MTSKLLPLACLATLALAACQPPADPAEPIAPAEPAPAAAPVAAEPAPARPPADVPFDTKGFAGTFSGTLPCADCPGIDTRLTLDADGTYRLHESYRGGSGRSFDGDGTWTAEDNGKRLRLDPNSKREPDRLFAIASPGRIDALGADGQPAAGGQPQSLTREDMMEGAAM